MSASLRSHDAHALPVPALSVGEAGSQALSHCNIKRPTAIAYALTVDGEFPALIHSTIDSVRRKITVAKRESEPRR